MPNALASVDHPFHAARFGEFLETLGDGHIPHWIAEHQGGYPSEFYPFGSSLLDMLVWLVSLGQMSTPMVHTWAVAVAFAVPAIGFLWICSLADMTAWVGVTALAAHLCVRGWWWSGGSHELIEWGLITNVLAAYLMFLALAGLMQIERTGDWRWTPVAAVLIAWGIWTNPRSFIALAAMVIALLVARLVHKSNSGGLFGPIAAIAGSLLLVAPLLIPLIRFNDLYYFVHFEGYSSVRDWLDSSIQAVSSPVFVIALVGLAIAFRPTATEAEMVLGYTFIAYCGATVYLVKIDWPGSLTEQLEITRLMPFQRLLMIALAGVAVGRALEMLAPQVKAVGGVAAVGLIAVLYVLAPPSWIPESDRGLVRAGTMATPGIADLRTSVEIADVAALDSSALLILGHTDYWHDHLWATIWSGRRFFYDDWLWYWQREHVGEYDPAIEHSYPLDSSAIGEQFLAIHGIGAVVVTGEAKPAAASAPFLTLIRSGTYDVYLVTGSNSLASLDGAAMPAAESDNGIEITGVEVGGMLTIRQNWFPRWRATANGEPIDIIHRADGYMGIPVPAGTSEVVLTYELDTVDWLARAAAVIGVLLMIALAVWPRPTARSEPR